MPLNKTKGRYEIKEVLAQGGMGVVYKAQDRVMKRTVALKTIRDVCDSRAMRLFQKECEDLASMIHPNIVEIYDVGEMEEEGEARPYLVMPLLPGVTLEHLIRSSSQRLTVERSVDMLGQACRGLQAAHERGLVHGDIKPSNIFVMDDDSVKIIDFGIAHRVDGRRTAGLKGTLLYMAPEQIRLKPVSALSDVFSLGVVCYEVLCGRRPFDRPADEDVAEAILHFVPPPASELNSAVSPTLSQVIHKAMAKEPWHRFSTAREFGETLQKAVRNDPIEIFNPDRMKSRLKRAAGAFEKGDYPFAAEILGELEAEGYLDPAISQLRIQIDAVLGQERITQLLESARTRIDEQEFPLALQKLQEVLQFDPNHGEALQLKGKLGNKRTELDIESWFELARQHIEKFAFGLARQALQRVLELRPKEGRALQMLSEVDQREEEYLRIRQEKEQLFKSALEARQHAELSSALSKLERVLELDRRAPEILDPGRGITYQNLYNDVRSERDEIRGAYAEARRQFENGNFSAALVICQEHLANNPSYTLFQALKVDAEEQQRQALSARLGEVDRRVECEPDLDRRVSMLEQAVRDNPGEGHFERSLQLTRDKRDLVESIVLRARAQEERGQCNEALEQWEMLGTIYPRYPGLSFEIERVTKRRNESLQFEARNRSTEQIDRHLEIGQYSRALELSLEAQKEFQSDELAQLEKLSRQGLERAVEAQRLLEEGKEHRAQHRFEDSVNALRQAYELDDRNPGIRAFLLETLIEQGRETLELDPDSADRSLQQALALEPGHALVTGLLSLIEDHRRRAFVEGRITQARERQAAGDLRGALQLVDEVLSKYPNEPRSTQLHITLRRLMQDMRRRDLEEVRSIGRDAQSVMDAPTLVAHFERMQKIAGLYTKDAEFETATSGLKVRVQTVVEGLDQTVGRARRKAPEQPPPKVSRLHASTAVVKAVRGRAERVRLRLGALGSWLREKITANRSFSFGAETKLSSPWVLIAAAVSVLIVGALLWPRNPKSRPLKPAAAALSSLQVTTSPSGAKVLIDNQERGIAASALNLQLKPGSYQVEAQMPGYESARSSVRIKPGDRLPLSLVLVPIAVRFQLVGSGQLTVDDERPVEIEGGQLQRNIPVGKHRLRVSSGRTGEVSFGFEVMRDGTAVVTDRMRTRELSALLVNNFGTRVRLYTSPAAVKAKFDKQSITEVGPNGMELPEVSPGPHSLEWGEGKDIRKESVDVGANSTLMLILLDADATAGKLVVEANEKDFFIIINGKRRDRPTKLATENIPLTAGDYVVQVAKEGYQCEPDSRSVQVRKGKENKLEFKFRKAVVASSLQVHTEPDAKVFLDGKRLGTTAADGMFATFTLSPGSFVLEVRKNHYVTEKQAIQLVPGPNSLVIPMTKAVGTLILKGMPASSRVTYTTAGESKTTALEGITHKLPEGMYTIHASAPGYLATSSPVEITAGETTTLELALEPESHVQTRSKAGAMDGWENPGDWHSDAEWFVHTGGGFVKFSPTPVAGKISFTVVWRGGSRLKNFITGKQLQWFANYIDSKNYFLFKLDDKSFSCEQIKEGAIVELFRQSLSLNQGAHALGIEIARLTISHTVDGKPLKVLAETGKNLTAGHFGFKIEGKREVMLKDFRFEPRQ